MESNSPFLSQDYTHGFLVAASSAGAFSWAADNDKPFSIGQVHSIISKNIKNSVYQFAEKEKDDSEFLYAELKSIEEAFE